MESADINVLVKSCDVFLQAFHVESSEFEFYHDPYKKFQKQ